MLGVVLALELRAGEHEHEHDFESMKRPLIAITPSPQSKGWEFSDRSISLSLCYSQAIEATGGVPFAVPLTTDRITLRKVLDTVDGLLLTGGGDVAAEFYDKRMPKQLRKTLGSVDIVRDEMELRLVHEAVRREIPVLGICRGHQVMNVAFGGTLIVDLPTQVKGCLRHSREDRKNDAVHDIHIEPDTRLAGIFGRSKLGVNSSHHQAIDELGKGLRVSARSSDGVIEGIESCDGSFTVGVQFHPERMWQVHRVILRLFQAFTEAASHR